MDRDLVDIAKIDVRPDRARIILGVDHLQIPFAGLDLGIEVDVDRLTVIERAGAEDVLLPAVRLGGGDIDLLQLVAGAVDQPEILLRPVGQGRRRDRNASCSGGHHQTAHASPFGYCSVPTNLGAYTTWG